MKRLATDLEKIFANYIINTLLVIQIYEELYFNRKKSIIKSAKDFNEKVFHQGESQVNFKPLSDTKITIIKKNTPSNIGSKVTELGSLHSPRANDDGPTSSMASKG